MFAACRLAATAAARRHGTRTTSFAALSSIAAAMEETSKVGCSFIFAAVAAAGAGLVYTTGHTMTPITTTQLENANPKDEEENDDNDDNTTTTLLNWSGTHQVITKHFWEPESEEELQTIVQECHKRGQRIRPVGSSLSPNGIGFSSDGMVSLANLDEIIHIHPEDQTVTVQAGARVSHVLEALAEHGLTLPNLASIAEQQMGGFVQVGAHGTGAKIAPVDHYVTSLKVVTPACGTLTLTAKEHGELFHLVKVGLGCLGIVTEVTMQCIPSHELVEHTFVLSRKEAKEQLDKLLHQHKHVRYMWIPYTNSVVVVTNDPEQDVSKDIPRNERQDDAVCLKPMRDLYKQLNANKKNNINNVDSMGFGELRDVLLAIDPLNVQHVRQVNQAEADFWKRSEGYQTKPSEQLLQFDCGGQQWVWEVAFPTGTYDSNNGNDIKLMESLLDQIEERNIPAPAPIEQRWSASSSSLMSPVHGSSDEDGLHSWVGIIMYLPELQEDEEEGKNSPAVSTIRQDITDRFQGPYCDLLREIGQEVNISSHWAKLELPQQFWKLVDLQIELQHRYPLEKFEAARDMLDPKRILGNSLLNIALVKGGGSGSGESTKERRKDASASTE